MAIYSQSQLVSASNATYTTNGAGGITGATVRALNVDWVSSSILAPMTSSMTVLSASYAATASVLLGSIVSASLATNNLFTASVASNTITFTKGDASTFSLVVATGSATGGSDFPYTGSAIISGSLDVIGRLNITGSAYGNIVPITISSFTASVDLSKGNFFTFTLANSTNTNINVQNVKQGVTANIFVTTGTSATSTFSSNVKQPSGSAYVAGTTPGQIDALSLSSPDGTNVYLVSLKNFI